MSAWFTCYRCGCTLLTTDYPHPPHCPGHAPGMTTWDYSAHAARTQRMAPTEHIPSVPAGVAMGLEGEADE